MYELLFEVPRPGMCMSTAMVSHQSALAWSLGMTEYLGRSQQRLFIRISELRAGITRLCLQASWVHFGLYPS